MSLPRIATFWDVSAYRSGRSRYARTFPSVEHRDLVLPDDDVVVHPDVPRDLPHDVLSLELVVPGDRHGADDAFLPARRLIRPPRTAEEERNRDHVFTSPGCR